MILIGSDQFGRIASGQSFQHINFFGPLSPPTQQVGGPAQKENARQTFSFPAQQAFAQSGELHQAHTSQFVRQSNTEFNDFRFTSQQAGEPAIRQQAPPFTNFQRPAENNPPANFAQNNQPRQPARQQWPPVAPGPQSESLSHFLSPPPQTFFATGDRSNRQQQAFFTRQVEDVRDDRNRGQQFQPVAFQIEPPVVIGDSPPVLQAQHQQQQQRPLGEQNAAFSSTKPALLTNNGQRVQQSIVLLPPSRQGNNEPAIALAANSGPVKPGQQRPLEENDARNSDQSGDLRNGRLVDGKQRRPELDSDLQSGRRVVIPSRNGNLEPIFSEHVTAPSVAIRGKAKFTPFTIEPTEEATLDDVAEGIFSTVDSVRISSSNNNSNLANKQSDAPSQVNHRRNVTKLQLSASVPVSVDVASDNQSSVPSLKQNEELRTQNNGNPPDFQLASHANLSDTLQSSLADKPIAGQNPRLNIKQVNRKTTSNSRPRIQGSTSAIATTSTEEMILVDDQSEINTSAPAIDSGHEKANAPSTDSQFSESLQLESDEQIGDNSDADDADLIELLADISSEKEDDGDVALDGGRPEDGASSLESLLATGVPNLNTFSGMENKIEFKRNSPLPEQETQEAAQITTTSPSPSSESIDLPLVQHSSTESLNISSSTTATRTIQTTTTRSSDLDVSTEKTFEITNLHSDSSKTVGDLSKFVFVPNLEFGSPTQRSFIVSSVQTSRSVTGVQISSGERSPTTTVAAVTEGSTMESTTTESTKTSPSTALADRQSKAIDANVRTEQLLTRNKTKDIQVIALDADDKIHSDPGESSNIDELDRLQSELSSKHLTESFNIDGRGKDDQTIKTFLTRITPSTLPSVERPRHPSQFLDRPNVPRPNMVSPPTTTTESSDIERKEAIEKTMKTSTTTSPASVPTPTTSALQLMERIVNKTPNVTSSPSIETSLIEFTEAPIRASVSTEISAANEHSSSETSLTTTPVPVTKPMSLFERLFNKAARDDISSLIPAGFSLSNDQVTTTSTTPVTGVDALFNPVKQDSIISFLPASFTFSTENPDEQTSTTTTRAKPFAGLFDSIVSDDVSAFLPPGFKEQINTTTTTTTTPKPLAGLFDSIISDDVSAFLPPGFKQHLYTTSSTTEHAKNEDNQPNEPVTQSSSATNEESTHKSLVFPSRRPRPTTSEKPKAHRPLNPVIEIKTGWPVR